MRMLISSFLVTFFSPAGLFPTASLAKHRKPRPQESSRFPIWRRQGSGKRVTSCYVSFYNDNVFANIFVRRVKNSKEIKTHFDDEM